MTAEVNPWISIHDRKPVQGERCLICNLVNGEAKDFFTAVYGTYGFFYPNAEFKKTVGFIPTHWKPIKR